VRDRSRVQPLVLVIDDDESTRSLARASLAGAGFAVIEAVDSGEALQRQAVHRPDLLLLDLSMPLLDGYEVCRRVRQRAEGSVTPILVMTVKDDVDAIEGAFAAGATDFLVKPMNPALLAHRVRYMLRAAATFQESRDNASRLGRAQRLARLAHWQLLDGSFEWSSDPLAMFGSPRPAPACSLVTTQSIGDLLALVHPEDRAKVGSAIARGEPHELDYRMVLPDGRVRLVHQDAEADPGGPEGALLGATQDVTAMRLAEQQIIQLAFFDEVTGLPNREFMRRYLARVAHGEPATVPALSVFSIDLGIARIKDSLSTSADALLVAAAARVVGRLGGGVLHAHDPTIDPNLWDGDLLVARVGDDELVVVFRGGTPEAAAVVGEQLIFALSREFTIQESEIFITASLGLASFPAHVRDPLAVESCARQAMVHSRELGRGSVAVFDADLETCGRRRMEISRLLHRSMARLHAPQAAPEFQLHYQPKIDPTTGALAGVEALLRWRPDGHAPIAPDQFIPIAEATGVIVPLGDWVLREACAQGARWVDGGVPLRVAVNISPRQLREPRFVTHVVRAVAKAGFSPALLELEITEHVTMHDFEHAVSVLRELKALGVQIALDDFGIGYSSLSYLSRLPIDSLKIDRSFILQIGKVAAAEAIPTAIIAMARSLGLRVVAEGVETIAQAEFLDRQGACELQGFLFARPMPACELDQILAGTGTRSFRPTYRSAADGRAVGPSL
jgi:EAL domain-containing protein (putative c-di-GMP-specific phosphodiesterase class I)/PleD family two-component response regulator